MIRLSYIVIVGWLCLSPIQHAPAGDEARRVQKDLELARQESQDELSRYLLQADASPALLEDDQSSATSMLRWNSLASCCKVFH